MTRTSVGGKRLYASPGTQAVKILMDNGLLTTSVESTNVEADNYKHGGSFGESDIDNSESSSAW